MLESKENNFVIESEVNENHVFVEIIQNKSYPLEIIREAISNSHDYKATEMEISAEVKNVKGKKRLIINIVDNGTGMDLDGFKRFAGLGFSESYQSKVNNNAGNLIGEKGHGTLLYFCSDEVSVVSKKDGKCYKATWNNPWERVCVGEKLVTTVDVSDCSNTDHGTRIQITGYADNDSSLFALHIMRDYIEWKTKFGSFEDKLYSKCKDIVQSTLKVIKLSGVDTRDEPIHIYFGHPFPKESEDINALFEDHIQDAPKYYCKRIIKTGTLPNHPEYSWHAVISLEGDYIKRDTNPFLGKKKAKGLYNVQDRYGLWVCKDFIPVQRKNEWIVTKGSEFTRYHAFFNCQAFVLTANRGSVDSTDTRIMLDIENVVKEIRVEIENSTEWEYWDYLEGQASGEKTRQREESDWKRRIDRVKRKKIAEYNGAELVEPRQESGVYALLIQTSQLDPTLYPFEIIDYDTNSGIDIIVRTANDRNLGQKYDYKYMELKYNLEDKFNHCFKYIYGIICWQISEKVLRGDPVYDAIDEARHLVENKTPGGITSYFLEKSNDSYRVPVIVLESYLKEKRNINFNKVRNI